ncbi:hypothetical protein, partial [Prevotella pallens]|uniref:hypothetical protein n=1 Tax=Prevotella pallens TaxID=60133 RepID=UPI0028DAFB7E
MDIIIKPDNISLVGSMKRIVLSSEQEVIFILSYADNNAPIVQHTYTPDSHNRIEINLEDVIAPLLYFELQDIESAYLQNHIARDFKATIRYEGEKIKTFTFTAIRAGVDRLADSAENFLKGNFLTWQPSVKPVTYNTPEFLTYYALTEGFVKCVGYYHTERIVGLVKGDEKTIANLQKDKAQTIPVQYAIMAKLFGFLPEYYDVWVEDTEGKRLTYIQRYYASDIRSEEEQWVLFENSLGGIDTFRAYGDTTFTAKHTHNIAEIENDAEEYRVDTAREYKKNTGHLNKEERRWLLDFFPSLGKYIYIDNYIRRIVVTDSEASYEAKELPSNFNFTFKYADARPYLNLRRSAVPAKMMDIKVPELGSFTIAPRLVEFQRLNLSGGALFPVQNPYADEWNVTTIAAIIDFIVEVLEKSYSANGGVGHTHTNYSLLQSLSFLNGYLLENGNKIKAGYADKARDLEEPVEDRFLSKLKADTAKELITFLKGITFGDSIQNIGFAKGFNGFGVWLDDKGRAHGQIDYLEVIGKAIFRSLQIDEYKHIGGNIVLSGANAVIEKVVPVSGGWKCYLHTDDGDKAITNDWEPGDQALCQTFNIKAGVYENVSNRYYWRCVSAVAQKSATEKAYIVITADDAYRDKSTDNDAPMAGDNIVLCGHNSLWDVANGIDPTRNRNRMNVTMITTSKEEGGTIEVYRNIHDFSLSKGNAIFHLSSDKIYMNSQRFEWISSDGERIPNVIYRGDWAPGTVAARYEAWYYGGGTWLSLEDG